MFELHKNIQCVRALIFALLWLLPKCGRQDAGLGGPKLAFSCSHPFLWKEKEDFQVPQLQET